MKTVVSLISSLITMVSLILSYQLYQWRQERVKLGEQSEAIVDAMETGGLYETDGKKPKMLRGLSLSTAVEREESLDKVERKAIKLLKNKPYGIPLTATEQSELRQLTGNVERRAVHPDLEAIRPPPRVEDTRTPIPQAPVPPAGAFVRPRTPTPQEVNAEILRKYGAPVQPKPVPRATPAATAAPRRQPPP